jgi:hypothetical protein
VNFSPAGGHEIWGHSYINNYLVDVIMIPTFFFAVGTFALGLKRFIADMHANALAEGKTKQEKIDPAGFVQAFIKNHSDHFQAPEIRRVHRKQITLDRPYDGPVQLHRAFYCDQRLFLC